MWCSFCYHGNWNKRLPEIVTKNTQAISASHPERYPWRWRILCGMCLFCSIHTTNQCHAVYTVDKWNQRTFWDQTQTRSHFCASWGEWNATLMTLETKIWDRNTQVKRFFSPTDAFIVKEVFLDVLHLFPFISSCKFCFPFGFLSDQKIFTERHRFFHRKGKISHAQLHVHTRFFPRPRNRAASAAKEKYLGGKPDKLSFSQHKAIKSTEWDWSCT